MELFERFAAHHPRAAAAHLCEGMDLAREVGDGVGERDGTLRVLDGGNRAVHDGDPVRDLLHVGDGGGEPDELHVLRRVDDDLFPDGAATLVAHIVALVQHDIGEVAKAARVEHVAQDLRRHDEDGRARVDLHVAGEDADGVPAVRAREVAELLVRERLERRRVGDAPPALERGLDRVLRHEGLARAGRRGDEHGLAGFEGADGVDLERVEREREASGETLEQLHFFHSTTSGRLHPRCLSRSSTWR